jgi:hypothetical protein
LSNSYQRARQEWDERYADLVLCKRNSQIAAAGSYRSQPDYPLAASSGSARAAASFHTSSKSISWASLSVLLKLSALKARAKLIENFDTGIKFARLSYF